MAPVTSSKVPSWKVSGTTAQGFRVIGCGQVEIAPRVVRDLLYQAVAGDGASALLLDAFGDADCLVRVLVRGGVTPAPRRVLLLEASRLPRPGLDVSPEPDPA